MILKDARASLLALALIALGACSRSPSERTRDASGAGPLATSGNGAFMIFSNELRSGGGAFFYPGGENQTLTFSDTSNPVSARSMRYNWTGQNVSDGAAQQHIFAGFDLMHTALLADYAGTPGRDLRQAGYTKVTFYARGALSTNTISKVEVSARGDGTAAPCISFSTNGTDDDTTTPCGTTAQLNRGWTQYSIPITSTNLAAVKDYFKNTFIFTPLFVGSTEAGQGGTIYFDQIQYEP